MNVLVDEIDDALTALYSGKSPMVFGASTFEPLMGLRFHFGDPSKRVILAGNTLEYDHSKFTAIETALGSMGAYDDETKVGRFREPTQAEYESIAGMFGIRALQSAAQLNNAWLFDWSLKPHRVSVFRGELLRPWLSPDRHVRDEIILPYERLHDHAVADIIFEGWDPAVFDWPAEWSKFGCLRFHNLDFKRLTIHFQNPVGTVDVEPFGCKTVRQYGANDGIREGLDGTMNYLWRFRSGDAPIFNATRNLDAGVWGTNGYSSLASIQLFHDLLDHAGVRFHFDPRIRWNGASLYADTFGSLYDDDCVAKYQFHAGTYRSLKQLQDGSWDSSVQSIEWIGNTLSAGDLAVATSEGRLTLSSAHAGPHDVIALTTNALPAAAHDINNGPSIIDAGLVYLSTNRFATTTDTIEATYYSGGSPTTVSQAINLVTVGTIPENITPRNAFSMTLGECKLFKLATEEDVQNGFTIIGTRGMSFDGRELLMSWTQTVPLTHAGLAENLSTYYAGLSDWGLWQLDDTSIELRHAVQLRSLASGYAILPGRLRRYAEQGTGYYSGGRFFFTDHNDLSRVNPDDGEDFGWTAPAPTKTDLRYHGEAPVAEATRNLPVYPVGSSWPRSAEASVVAAWWQAHRNEILAGQTTQEDAQKVWRIPGAKEHYNHVAARLNAMVGISPFQLFDLLQYGAPLNTGSRGITVPPGFGGRLDGNPEAAAIVEGFGIRKRTLLDTVMSEFYRVPIPSDAVQFEPGQNRTWLYVALPTIGFDASDDMPTFEWITQDDLVTIATAYGVPHFQEAFRQPQRVEIIRSAWYQASGEWRIKPTLAAFFSDQEADFVSFEVDDVASTMSGAWAVSTWIPWYREPSGAEIPDKTEAEIDSFNANPLFEPTRDATPPGAGARFRALLIEQTLYGPNKSTRWEFRSDSKLLIQPEPQINWTGTTTSSDASEVPAGTFAAPPIDARAIDIDTVMDGATTKMLDPLAIRAAWERGSEQGSQPWGNNSMTYLTLFRRCGCFRR